MCVCVCEGSNLCECECVFVISVVGGRVVPISDTRLSYSPHTHLKFRRGICHFLVFASLPVCVCGDL